MSEIVLPHRITLWRSTIKGHGIVSFKDEAYLGHIELYRSINILASQEYFLAAVERLLASKMWTRRGWGCGKTQDYVVFEWTHDFTKICKAGNNA